MGDGRQLEEHVAVFFRSLGYLAEVDVRVVGARGTHRVDVFVVFSGHGIEHRWVIECKDRVRKATKADVLTLQGVVTDIGANAGFLISPAGYQSGAITAARASNIVLSTLEELRDRAEGQRAVDHRRAGEIELLATANDLAARAADLWARAVSNRQTPLLLAAESALMARNRAAELLLRAGLRRIPRPVPVERGRGPWPSVFDWCGFSHDGRHMAEMTHDFAVEITNCDTGETCRIDQVGDTLRWLTALPTLLCVRSQFRPHAELLRWEADDQRLLRWKLHAPASEFAANADGSRIAIYNHYIRSVATYVVDEATSKLRIIATAGDLPRGDPEELDGRLLWHRPSLAWICPEDGILREVDATGTPSFSADSSLVAVKHRERVQVIDVAANRTLWSIEQVELDACVLSPDGKYLGTVSEGVCYVWQVGAELPLRVLPGRGWHDLQWLPDSSGFVLASMHGRALRWDATTGEVATQIELDDSIQWYEISVDGRLLMAAGEDAYRRYPIESASEALTLLECYGGIATSEGVVACGAEWIGSFSLDGTVESRTSVDGHHFLSTTGATFVELPDPGTVRIRSTADGSLLRQFDIELEWAPDFGSCSDDGSTTLVICDAEIALFRHGTEADRIGGLPLSSAVASDGQVAAAIVSDSGNGLPVMLYIWDLRAVDRRGKPYAWLLGMEDYLVFLSASGTTVALSSYNQVFVYPIASLMLPVALVSPFDAPMLPWTRPTMRTSLEERIGSVAFSVDDRWIALGDQSGTVVVIDRESGAEVAAATVAAEISKVSISPDNRHLVVSTDGRLEVLKVDIAELVEEMGRRLTRNLAYSEWDRYLEGPYHATYPGLHTPTFLGGSDF